MSECMIDTEADNDAEQRLPDAEADGYSWGPLLADGSHAEAHRGCGCSADPEPANRFETITEAAQSAVYGGRGDDYGHPRQDWNRQALIWTALLQPKLAEGEFITPEDIGRCMIGVKLARDVHSPVRDNRTDIAGYALCLDRLETGQ